MIDVTSLKLTDNNVRIKYEIQNQIMITKMKEILNLKILKPL